VVSGVVAAYVNTLRGYGAVDYSKDAASLDVVANEVWLRGCCEVCVCVPI